MFTVLRWNFIADISVDEVNVESNLRKFTLITEKHNMYTIATFFPRNMSIVI